MMLPYLSAWALSNSMFGTGWSSSINFGLSRPISSAEGAAARLLQATGPQPGWSCGIQRCEDVVERVDHNHLRWGVSHWVILQCITKKTALRRLFVLPFSFTLPFAAYFSQYSVSLTALAVLEELDSFCLLFLCGFASSSCLTWKVTWSFFKPRVCPLSCASVLLVSEVSSIFPTYCNCLRWKFLKGN